MREVGKHNVYHNLCLDEHNICPRMSDTTPVCLYIC